MYLSWEGNGVNEVGKEKDTLIVRIKVNPKFYRPTEVEFLLGDASKAQKILKWSPKISFHVISLFRMRCCAVRIYNWKFFVFIL